ncbi:SDR family NAD(P)-dependent oxidoreductase [Paenibacillus sp.]|jgi:polyketide synthase PksN|uniref:SDR family NAD(P)-dependent oxidoreductase n=1 Tax=Paenibacillus sp. TaxID=58172 RepID=UPI002821DC47|nr:SDR family NAD(P)-dependent oxidoreductase [Paenibacillus sp.]MDR0270279.1 SDR family NAD(P)-dependent oxidoreductase [Paenibacillus sp.]
MNKEGLNRFVLEQLKGGNINRELAFQLLKAIDGSNETMKQDIAVIGVACKFPGADNAEQFWSNLKQGVETVGDFPSDRLKDVPAKPQMKAGYLKEIDKFDASFFRLSPREAALMHPTQRLFLETVWETIEDAGYSNEKINGSNTAVYVGIDHTYKLEYGNVLDDQDLLVMTGSMTSVLASRISYILNLRGPSLVIDTACSSGLVSIHTACRALRSGECSMALAGGVNLIHHFNAKFEGVESGDGKLSAFDKNSKGTVWGEGVGVLLLKPLKRALEDHDQIYAVIKGSAMNNDGTTNGITAPSAETQSQVILSAWEDAGIDPETLTYIEAHATGTVLGDPIEIRGLKAAFENHTTRKQFCGIGAVKPNIGHSVGAAAISSLIKVILSMKHKEIPPNINFWEPNPYIDFCNTPLYVNDKLTDWETDGVPRRAGVSSFGFSRTNCHIVLEEAPQIYGREDDRENGEPYVFTLSAKSEQALQDYIYKYVAGSSEIFFGNQLADICSTSNTGRGHYSHRLAVVCVSKDQLLEKLSKITVLNSEQLLPAGIHYGAYRVLNDPATGTGSPGEILRSTKKEFDLAAKNNINELVTAGGNREQILKQLCELYVLGADVDWGRLYQETSVWKVSLPTYPFIKKRHWITSVKMDTQSEKILHPLVENLAVDSMDVKVFTTTLHPNKHWILTDHIIANGPVVPGTAYLEMARVVGHICLGTGNLELKDVILLTPLVVTPGETKELHIVVNKSHDKLSFRIACKSMADADDDGPEWVVHAEGTIRRHASEKPTIKDIQLPECDIPGEPIQLQMSEPQGVFMFGPRWNCIDSLYHHRHEVLVNISLSRNLASDVETYQLHPALLDCAINMGLQQLSQSTGGGVYLPLSFKSIKLYESLPAVFTARQTIRDDLFERPNTVTSDIVLYGDNGIVLAEIEGYTVKLVEESQLMRLGQTPDKIISSEIGWIYSELETMPRQSSGAALIILENPEDERELLEELQTAYATVYEVVIKERFLNLSNHRYEIGTDGDSFQSLLNHIDNGMLIRIIYVLGGSWSEEPDSLEAFQASKDRSIMGLFHLARALPALKNRADDIEVVLIGDQGHAVIGTEQYLNPYHAAAFALAKVLAREYPSIGFRCIDRQTNTPSSQLLDEITASAAAFKTAYRDGQRYIEQLNELNMEAQSREEWTPAGSGVYLISGGLGGIGLEIAKYLGSKGAKQIALIGRGVFPAKQMWGTILETQATENKLVRQITTLKEIEKGGSNIEYIQADVSHFAVMEQVVGELRRTHGRINGIVHCAGMAGRGFIINKLETDFEAVSAPKMEGTWILDKLTEADQPDFFIMFSSLVASVGVAGQGDYAASNAFMDAFSSYRTIKGGKSISISWPVWLEAGMAKELNTSGFGGPFKPIRTKEALRLFEAGLNGRIPHILAGEPDAFRLDDIEDALCMQLSDSYRKRMSNRGKMNAAAFGSVTPEVSPASEVKVKGIAEGELSEYQLAVGRLFAKVLGTDEVNIHDSFIELGGDSIIAASLLREFEAIYPGTVDISDIFTFPTVYQLSELLEKKLEIRTASLGKQETERAVDETAIENIMDRLGRGEISSAEADELIKAFSN